MNLLLRIRHRFAQLFATRKRRVAATVLGGIFAAGALFGFHAGLQAPASQPPAELAAMLPSGALLTIESSDFAGLLKRWNDSPQKAAWLRSDNFSVFSRSRLFGRLGDAQDQFAQTAGLPPDMRFLTEVAGKESIFAWYDIGNLEFLYISRLPAGAADKSRLLQMRNKFAARKIGAQTFYVKTDTSQQGGQQRTVAFTTSSDWLLLATREDLMAGALILLENKSSVDSLAAQPWFTDAHAAAGKSPGQLRMTLNLDKIVPSPYFRSYWVQRNITEMKQYRSAVADLYLDSAGKHNSIREERVLLPKSVPDAAMASAEPDLGRLVDLLPQRAGVYRAVAAPTVDAAVSSINEKLLVKTTGANADGRFAPVADLSVHDAGSSTDLESRIDLADTSLSARPAKDAELASLRQLLEDSGLEAMMTVGRTGDPADGIWIPFQSAIVLSSAKDWNTAALQTALKNALQAHLTAGGVGLEWKQVKASAGAYFEISDTRPLEMAIRGHLCILADDPGLMIEMLDRLSVAAPPQSAARLIVFAGATFPQERTSFARWSTIVDHTGPAGVHTEPAFFSQNIRSLADAFSALESEQLVERRDGSFTRQTVTYSWQR